MKKTIIPVLLLAALTLTSCEIFQWGDAPVEQTAPVASVSEIRCGTESGFYSFEVKCQGKWGICYDNSVDWLDYNTDKMLTSSNNEGDKTIRFGIKESIDSDTLVIRLYNEKGTTFVKVFHPWPERIRFSVDEGKCITFAPGNLQYRASTDTWRFAPSQFDAVGESNSLISPTYDGWIDLFGWGTGDDPTRCEWGSGNYQTFVDWGTNTIDNYAPGTWRTMTLLERNYLISSRPNASLLVGTYYINGQRGAYILPDSCLLPTGFHTEGNKTNGHYTLQGLNEKQVAQLLEHGAIFLPVCGYRYEHEWTNDASYYWCYSENRIEEGECISVSTSCTFNTSYVSKDLGGPVRLIKEIE